MQARVGFVFSAEEYACSWLAGVRLSDYYGDVRLMAAAQRTAGAAIASALGTDPPAPSFHRGHVKCPEYLGCGIFQPEDDEPFVRSPALADLSSIGSFAVPDPPDNPVAREHLAKTRRFHELTGVKASIGVFEGPFTTAAFARGQSEFLVDWIDRPAACERLVATVTDAVIAWKRWHDAEMGIGPERVTALVDDSITLVSPSDFEAIVLPHLERWYEAFPSSRREFHCCADIGRHLPAIARLRLTHLASIGEMVDPAEAGKALPGAGVSQLFDFRVLRDRPDEEVVAAAARILEHAPADGTYAIVVEGARGVPLERARLIRDTVLRFDGGRIPDFDPGPR